jgi:hypothetical protein
MAIPSPRASAITRSAAASAFIYVDNLSGRVTAILGHPLAQLGLGRLIGKLQIFCLVL